MAAARPNMKEFMDATGADAATASELLYGVVGANRDTRDWSSIMSASDPIAAASRATGEMYAAPAATQATQASGQYATIAPSSGAPSLVRYFEPNEQRELFAIVAADGTPLRAGFGTEEQARAQGNIFGISGDIGTGQYVAPRAAPPAAPVAAQPVATQPSVPAPITPVGGGGGMPAPAGPVLPNLASPAPAPALPSPAPAPALPSPAPAAPGSVPSFITPAPAPAPGSVPSFITPVGGGAAYQPVDLPDYNPTITGMRPAPTVGITPSGATAYSPYGAIAPYQFPELAPYQFPELAPNFFGINNPAYLEFLFNGTPPVAPQMAPQMAASPMQQGIMSLPPTGLMG